MTLYAERAIALSALFSLSAFAEVQGGAEGRNSSGNMVVGANASEVLPNPGDSVVPFARVLVLDSLVVEEGGALLVRDSGIGPLYLLVSGVVDIRGALVVRGGAGTSTKAGSPGPGAFPGGAPATAHTGPSSGLGPGGGDGIDCTAGGASGGATHALSSTAVGGALGAPFAPATTNDLLRLAGGSGGGGSDAGGGPNAIHQSGGGGGGGAILITSDTSITVSGTIDARGGDAPTTGSRACKSPGSGGAIRLVAPVVNITGTLDVRGGTFGDGTAETGSPGRVRIDTLNPASVNLLGIRPSLAELGNDPARVDATRSVGTNLVAFPDVMPELTITHFRGVPLPRGPATTLPIYVEATGTSEQLITLSAAGLGQANAIIAITPRHGPRILSSPIALDTTSGPVTWTGPVILPGNVDARIDVWVTP